MIGPTAWTHSSINSYKAVLNWEWLPSTVPLVVGLLVLCLLGYIGVTLFRKPRLALSWRVPAALVFAAWLSLDLLWQAQLLSRLEDTWRVFGGLNSEQRMAAAADGELYLFIQKVKKISRPSRGRYFVATTDDYRGMRGSYHLLPTNVYWRRHKSGLPTLQNLRKGDLIVVIRPSDIRFNPGNGTILLNDQQSMPVASVLSESMGAVFRVL